MIHVNVRPSTAIAGDCIVETSTDGAGWKVQYTVRPGPQGDAGQPRRDAEAIARTMGVAWTYAGVAWRGTTHGEELLRV